MHANQKFTKTYGNHARTFTHVLLHSFEIFIFLFKCNQTHWSNDPQSNLSSPDLKSPSHPWAITFPQLENGEFALAVNMNVNTNVSYTQGNWTVQTAATIKSRTQYYTLADPCARIPAFSCAETHYQEQDRFLSPQHKVEFVAQYTPPGASKWE